MTEDPRSARSRALLHFAVRDNLTTEGTEGLSVTSLCRRAGLHRTTFYQHYEDLPACVADAVVEPVAADLAAAIGATPVPWSEGEVDDDALTTWGSTVRDRISRHLEVLAAMLGRGSDMAIVHELVEETVRTLVAAGGSPSRMKLRTVVALTVLADLLGVGEQDR